MGLLGQHLLQNDGGWWPLAMPARSDLGPITIENKLESIQWIFVGHSFWQNLAIYSKTYCVCQSIQLVLLFRLSGLGLQIMISLSPAAKGLVLVSSLELCPSKTHPPTTTQNRECPVIQNGLLALPDLDSTHRNPSEHGTFLQPMLQTEKDRIIVFSHLYAYYV